MPAYYLFHCSSCDWRQERYRNLKRCPVCGADAVREEPLSEADELRVEVTRLQARLDTHHQQTRALIQERDALRALARNVTLSYQNWREGLLNSGDEMILAIEQLEEAIE